MLQLHHGVPNPHALAMEDVSDFFLIEASEYLRYPFYRGWCNQTAQRRTTVLDNGTGIGETTPWKDVLHAAEILEPTYLVLPDTLYDKARTLASAWAALEEARYLAESVKFTLVIQGKTEMDLIYCLDDILNSDLQDLIGCLGVPFRMWEGSPDSARYEFVQDHIQPILGSISKPIHLFGCRYMRDYSLGYCDLLDTRMAFKYATRGYHMEEFIDETLPKFKNPIVMDRTYSQTVVDIAHANALHLNGIRDYATKNEEER